MCSLEELSCNTTDVLSLHDANLQHVPVKIDYNNSRKENIYIHCMHAKTRHTYMHVGMYVKTFKRTKYTCIHEGSTDTQKHYIW